MGILEEGVLFEWESNSIPRLDVREVFHIHLEQKELRSWPKEIIGSAALTCKSYLFQKGQYVGVPLRYQLRDLLMLQQTLQPQVRNFAHQTVALKVHRPADFVVSSLYS